MTDLHIEGSQNTTLATHLLLLLLHLQLLLIEEIVDSLSRGSHCARRNKLLEESPTPTSTNVDDSVTQLRIVVVLVFSLKDVVDNLPVALHVVDLPSIVGAAIVHVPLIATNYVKYSCPQTICLDRCHTDY